MPLNTVFISTTLCSFAALHSSPKAVYVNLFVDTAVTISGIAGEMKAMWVSKTWKYINTYKYLHWQVLVWPPCRVAEGQALLRANYSYIVLFSCASTVKAVRFLIYFARKFVCM